MTLPFHSIRASDLAKGGGAWWGVSTARDGPERHPPPTRPARENSWRAFVGARANGSQAHLLTPCLRRGGSRARGFRHSYNADDDLEPLPLGLVAAGLRQPRPGAGWRRRTRASDQIGRAHV